MRSSRRAGMSFSGKVRHPTTIIALNERNKNQSSPIGYFASNNGRSRREARVADRGLGRLNWADFVEKPRLLAATVSVGAAVSRGKEVCSASCGEDRFREGDDLRQLPQILGCGGQ